jgi:serine/threonine protein kinase
MIRNSDPDGLISHDAAGGGKQHDPCPSRNELAEFLHGVVTRPAEVARMERHLDQCAACSTAAGGLMDESDTIAHMMRYVDHSTPIQASFLKAQARLLARTDLVEGQASADRPLPQCLGQYELLEPIGCGSTGRVFKARHKHLDRTVAVKVLAPRTLPDAECVARFRGEMRAVGRLQHPNIIHASDAAKADGFYFLVMEHCEGLTLSRILEQCGTLSVADACEIVRQTAAGLQAVSEHGIVHRDIKPSNLLLSADGQVKILDLGLAEICEPQRNAQSSAQPAIAHAAGTPEYMAPEQWEPQCGVDIRADIYALGCTLYKMLAGRSPFKTDEVRRTLDLRERHLQAPIPSILDRRPDIPSELEAVLARMLAKRREDRYSSPRRLARAIAPFAKSSRLPTLVRRSLGRLDEDTISDRLTSATTLTISIPARIRIPPRSIAVKLLLVGALALSSVAVAWPIFKPETLDAERANWADGALQVYTRASDARYTVTSVDGRPMLEINSDDLTMVALTEHLPPYPRIQAEFPVLTAKAAGVFFGFQEWHDRDKTYLGCFCLQFGKNEKGPVLMWRSLRWQPGKRDLQQETMGDYQLTAPIGPRIQLDVRVIGPAKIDVLVNGVAPVPIQNLDDDVQFTLATTSGRAGVFSGRGKQVFCDFSARPFHKERLTYAD